MYSDHWQHHGLKEMLTRLHDFCMPRKQAQSADSLFGSRSLCVNFYNGVGIIDPFTKKWQATAPNCQEYHDQSIQFGIYLYISPCRGYITNIFNSNQTFYTN